jgi:hypothetical protein
MDRPTKELKFIHITKNAGSSIEVVGLEKGKRWGINHTEYGFWHAIFPNKPKHLRDKYDWFMVVRNPYERVISDYNFLVNLLKIPNYSNKDALNTFIHTWITNILNNKENHPVHGRLNGGHFTQQFKYLDPKVTIHVLKFESLENDFNALMKKYDYNIVLTRKANISNKLFSVKDISEQNIKLIQEVYKKDFEQFNYSIDPPI